MQVAVLGQPGPYTRAALQAWMLGPLQPKPMCVVLAMPGMSGRAGLRCYGARPGGQVARSWWQELLGWQEPDCALTRWLLQQRCAVLHVRDIHAPHVVRELAAWQLDAMVCLGYPHLLRSQVLGLSARGVLNAHPSHLPDLRGPHPLFWALRRGDRTLGMTLHVMDRGEDTGPVLQQSAWQRPSGVSGDALYRVAGEMAVTLLEQSLAAWLSGRLRAVGQPPLQQPHVRARRPRPQDVELVPATWDCAHLVDFVSGAAYFRTPWLRLGRHTFFVERGIATHALRPLPGEYAWVGERLTVACRDGLATLGLQGVSEV